MLGLSNNLFVSSILSRPLFNLHRYWYPEQYLFWHNYPSYTVGFQLICVSFVLGYVIEEIFKSGMKYVRTWKSLLITVGTFAVIIGVLLVLIKRREPPLSIKHYLTPKEVAQVENEIQHLYILHDNSSIRIDSAKIMQLNMGLHLYETRFFGCKNKSKTLPVKEKELLRILSTFCHSEGEGSKNIVLIGNSHAKAAFVGVSSQFRHIYKHLTLFELEYCMPFFANHTAENSQIDYHFRKTPFWLNRTVHCIDFELNIMKILQSWETTIDLIIPVFEFYAHLNFPFDETTPMDDEYFRQMQQFYDNLNSIAREAVFVPNIHMDWRVEPFAQILQNRLYFKRDLELFSSTLEDQHSHLANVRRRVDKIQCEKCIKVDWADAWCSNKTCKALSSNNISYFYDSVHVNSLGSRIYGDLLLKLYEQQVTNLAL